MTRLRKAIRLVLLLCLIGAVALALWSYGRRNPQDLPWTQLDLNQPVGLFMGRKLAGLTSDADQCRQLLQRAGVRFTALPPRRDGQCGYEDGVRLTGGGALPMQWSPPAPGMSCPVAAGLALWLWHVVQPAAQAHLGTSVVQLEHYGTYSCRRLYGRDSGDWSEHATADAIDIAGFRLADGRLVTVRHDWDGDLARADFLREVRDGACKLFSTVLSPDYNRAHADHLHMDQAERGEMGWRMCR